MTRTLDGKVALATGGSRVIGRAIAVRLAQDGCAIVAFTYHSDADSAHGTAAAIEQAGAVAVPIQARLEKAGAAAGLFAALDAELTRRAGETTVDILVNNAGAATPASWPDADPATFDRLIAV